MSSASLRLYLRSDKLSADMARCGCFWPAHALLRTRLLHLLSGLPMLCCVCPRMSRSRCCIDTLGRQYPACATDQEVNAPPLTTVLLLPAPGLRVSGSVSGSLVNAGGGRPLAELPKSDLLLKNLDVAKPYRPSRCCPGRAGMLWMTRSLRGSRLYEAR